MALVKQHIEPHINGNAHIAAGADAGGVKGGNGRAAHVRDADAQRRKARTLAKQQQAAERVASATTQLSSGISEAASAAEELKRAMDQISSGAEESSGAAQESLRAVSRVADALAKTKANAAVSQQKAELLQKLIGTVANEIQGTVTNVGKAAQRQAGSVDLVKELERQAANIGEIVKAVVRIADQTNLLALNAAIEAARAGQHGKGFAVVADEVRTLAETSEKSAREIEALVSQIQAEVQTISEGINATANSAEGEVSKGRLISEQLASIRDEMVTVLSGAQDISSAAEQADRAAIDAQKGSEAIAAASEQQSSAAEEALKMVNEQSSALQQSEQASQDLGGLAEDLKNSTDIAKSAEEVASASEELSSAVQEINRASSQIMSALGQIASGSRQQAAAAQQSAAAVTQIDQGAQVAMQRANEALTTCEAVSASIAQNRTAVEALVQGILEAVEGTRKSRDQINQLELISRKIDKIVDAITTLSIQTNMLAVNGAIEAARAGEFGKGFVVVSTDIRNLAHDSSENTDRIKDMVKAVQDQIGTVRRDLEEIAAAAVGEVEKTKAISGNLTTVTGDVAVMLQGNREISDAASVVSQMINEVKKGVDQIASASTQTETAVNEASAAAKQQAQGAEELAAAIEEIASLADGLQSA